MPSVYTITRVSRVDLPYILFFLLHYLEFLRVDGMFLLLLFSDDKDKALFHEIVGSLDPVYSSRLHVVQGTNLQVHSMPPNVALGQMMDTILATFPRFLEATLESNDWLLSVDSDEYLYFPCDGHEYTLLRYLTRRSGSILQIQFPWVSVENTSPWLSPHPYDDILRLPWTDSTYMKSVVRVHPGLRYHDPHCFSYPGIHVDTTWVCDPSWENETAPRLFHLHSMSLGTTLNKVLYHRLREKSDEAQKEILGNAIRDRDPNVLASLYKIRLIERDIQRKSVRPATFTLCPWFHEVRHRHHSLDTARFLEKEKEFLHARIDQDAVEWIMESLQERLKNYK